MARPEKPPAITRGPGWSGPAARRRASRCWRIVAVIAGVLALASGCAAAETELASAAADPAVSEIKVVAGGKGAARYAFHLPGRVPPGPTRISLTNRGDEPHHAQLFKLKGDATVGDLAGAFAGGDPAAPLQHATLEGGTALVGPGQTSSADAVVDLTQGRHVVICLVEGPDGVPHLAHGMLHPFQVDGEPVRPARPAAAEAQVGLVDYGFQLGETVPAGGLLEVTNVAAAEPHELVVGRLHGGASLKEVRDALAAGANPPATFVGGGQAIAPGTSQRLRLDLKPGRYVLLCAVPSPDRTPHYAKGMIDEVTVT
jgi:hypothetical protein